MFRGGEIKDAEPPAHERCCARCHNGPGDWRDGGAEGGAEGTSTRDLGGIFAVEGGDFAFHLRDICGLVSGCLKIMCAICEARLFGAVCPVNDSEGGRRLTFPVCLFGVYQFEDIYTPSAMGSLQNNRWVNTNLNSNAMVSQ